MVRINFDEDSCIGSGICESLVADVFRTGDDGLTTLQREVVGDDRLEELQQAVSRCPTGAIGIASQR
ncbi:ferredoxin [Mycolicibacterium pyrenivorans]|uniref:ferredoxin n=1 Tax=Mycolicibacterium pyrenivorans TaxID=187102 RepID=UPI0021F2EEA0|nr:ferredoxin [Mycolicibacterium pyrenivorans]MCV7153486.1 ferredoxin [Mycolicibacterium pyrenivorans]